jgi:hypothetical protein
MFLVILLTSVSKLIANRLSATWKADTPDQNKSKNAKNTIENIAMFRRMAKRDRNTLTNERETSLMI